ncbi:hypothetical protein F5B18DRAFT_618705 [Nemania serpens]|nr:hypothetical protein F5B18DRAFT_618705 [Nemania serpens]
MMSRAIEGKDGSKSGSKRKRKRRNRVVLLEGDEEAPLPAHFRTYSLGSRADEDSREALVWLDTPGATDIFRDTLREDGEWPSFAPPPGDKRRTPKLKPMTPAGWAHAFRYSPMLLELFNHFGTKTIPKTTQEKENSIDTEIDDFTPISASSTSTLSDFDIDELGEDWDRLEDTPRDQQLMWSPPYPSKGVPVKAALIDSAARNRWRRIMTGRMENKERPQKWPKRSGFPAWIPRTTQDWIDYLYEPMESASKSASARDAQSSRERPESEASVNDDSQSLTASVSRSEMQTAAVTTEHTAASLGTSAQATDPQNATIEEDAQGPASASASSQIQCPNIMETAEIIEHSEGSIIPGHGKPGEVTESSALATALEASDNLEYHLVPEAVDDLGDHSSGALAKAFGASDNSGDRPIPETVDNSEYHSSSGLQAEGHQAMVHRPANGGRVQTSWR